MDPLDEKVTGNEFSQSEKKGLEGRQKKIEKMLSFEKIFYKDLRLGRLKIFLLAAKICLTGVGLDNVGTSCSGFGPSYRPFYWPLSFQYQLCALTKNFGKY